MTNEVAITATRLPMVKSLILQDVTLESYQRQVLGEAQVRVLTRQTALTRLETEIVEAQRGLDAAEYADIPTQIQMYRNLLTRRKRVKGRRTRQLEDSRKFLSLVEDGYLPVPRMDATNVRWLRDPLPPEVLETIGAEQTHERFLEFLVVGMVPEWQARRRRGVDPILVGVCDGEMFPLAWWR